MGFLDQEVYNYVTDCMAGEGLIKVLGISGSPIKNSNTDRVVKAVLEATGRETEFIKLKGYQIEPCRACLGCVDTN